MSTKQNDTRDGIVEKIEGRSGGAFNIFCKEFAFVAPPDTKIKVGDKVTIKINPDTYEITKVSRGLEEIKFVKPDQILK